jgi:hypothetical protein
MIKNPFLTYGYNGAEYFCDRTEETKRLTSLLVNGNHKMARDSDWQKINGAGG